MSRRNMLGYGLSLLLPLTAKATSLDATISALKAEPYQTSTLSETENQALFDKYCLGSANSAESPKPNYQNALVRAAAAKLSATKTTADQALYQNAVSQIAHYLSESKRLIQAVTKTTDSSVQGLAQELFNEIDSSKPELGFSAKVSTLAAQLKQSLATPLITGTQILAKNLPIELESVNYTSLTEIAKNLKTELTPRLQRVDFNSLQAASNEIIDSLIRDLDSNLDAGDLQNQIAIIEAQIPEQDTSSEIKYLKSSILSLKKETSLVLSGQPQEYIRYTIREVINGLQAGIKNKLITLDDKGNKALLQVRKQYFYASASELKEQMNRLLTSLAAQPETNKNDYNSAMYATTSLRDSVKPHIDSLSARTIKAYELFSLEAAKFSSAEILLKVAYLEEMATKKDSQAVGYSSTSLIYSLKEYPTPVTPQIPGLLGLLQIEIDKASTEETLAGIARLKSAADASQGQMTKQLFDTLSNVSYNLGSLKASLKPETQSALASVIDVNTHLQSLETLTYYLDESKPPENKKSQHFYFYGHVTKIYIPNAGAPNAAPEGTQEEAHTFLTQLCGEFRDRATMIEAKLKWATNIFILPPSEASTFKIDVNKNVWSQIPASAYYPYIQISSEIWEAKREAMPRYIQIGSEQVDNPVPGFTVCETKYIFSEYVGKQKSFDEIKSYYEGYKTYREACSVADRQDYYDFRGDSNFKHYSPESNGMIWYATTIARACKSPTTARPNQNGISDQDCRNYFSRPFYYRYNAARAGLAAWLFRDGKHEEQFSSQGKMVAIYPHRSPELAPFSFSYDHNAATGDLFDFDTKWLNTPGAWNSPDIGFNSLTGLGTDQADHVIAYKRIRDAVDRHTDWYHSGYNDKNGVSKEQAYSPFVASSYEMRESDNFTRCGTTVQCPDDGLKRWMFVFRVKPENWYHPGRILKNEPINFDKMWFDETSFGVSGLADKEKAWDRLGTPMEEELDSIVYLVNVQAGSGSGAEGEEGD